MSVDQGRVEAVADSLAEAGYDGIAAFDRTEPEYSTIEYLYDRYDSEGHVAVLVVLAATQDYQLNGDAQEFWRELEATAADHDTLDSTVAVRELLGDFMERSVNARLRSQKRDRLVRICDSGFDEWFVENHADVAPLRVWERLADALDTQMERKTVVLAMKIYDIAHLIRHGEYLEFPSDIPIPCDLQVERVSRTAGIVDTDDSDVVMSAWADVMDETTARLGKHVSLLRIDSIVWQAGQIIGTHEPDRTAAREALVDHFETVGLSDEVADRLAEELTIAM
jgi:N-glycosylase/DNA lyase